MYAENPFADESGCGQIIEQFDEHAVYWQGVALLALMVEPVLAANVRALVVATNQEHFVRVAYFVREEEANRFHALLPAVDEVAHDKIPLRGWRPATLLHHPEQVVKLPVKVAGDAEWRLDLEHGRLLEEEQVLRLRDQEAHVLVFQFHFCVHFVVLRLL